MITAMFVGTCACALSVLFFQNPLLFGPAVFLLFPGMIFGMAAGGNVHTFPAWAVAVGNFGFYFVAICLAQIVRKRFKSSTHV